MIDEFIISDCMYAELCSIRGIRYSKNKTTLTDEAFVKEKHAVSIFSDNRTGTQIWPIISKKKKLPNYIKGATM